MTPPLLLTAVLAGSAMFPGSALDPLKAPLGGISSLRYEAKTHTLYALPDRGPGDGTVAYTPRILVFDVVSTAPLKLELKRAVPFKDAAGETFSGLITSPRGHIDPEGLVLGPDDTLFVSEEYGPFIYQFKRDGTFLRRVSPPEQYLPDGQRGRTTNRGLEGLCMTPSGKRLVAVLQSPLAQDGGKQGRTGRLLAYDLPLAADPKPKEYTFDMVDASVYAEQGLKQSHFGINEIVALDEDSFLVLERDNRGFNAGEEPDEKPVYKRLIRLDLQKDGTAKRTPWLDLLQPLRDGGVDLDTVAPKFESIEWGPDQDGARTLWTAVDNDFRAKVPTHVFLLRLPKN